MPVKKQSKHYASVPIPHLLRPTKYTASSATEQLNLQLLAVYQKISLSEREIAERQKAFEKYKSIIESHMDCKVESFGSSRTTLYVRDSDIDITVLTDTSNALFSKNIFSSRTRGKGPVYSDAKPIANHVLTRVAKLIEASNMADGPVIHIKKAKTPILKFVDKLTGCKVDISINKVDGIQTAEYVNKILAERPQMRYFAIILKYFLKSRRLGDAATGGLCSYAQFLLILSFVQMHPLLQGGNIEIKEDLGVLFVDFFQFYGVDFPYDRTRISVKEMSYTKNDQRGIYIADPVIPGNNVSSGCSMIGFIRDVFQYSYRIMAAALSQKVCAQKSVVELWLRLGPRDERKEHKARS